MATVEAVGCTYVHQLKFIFFGAQKNPVLKRTGLSSRGTT